MSASPSRARIAVTGLGTVNPLGGDVASTWQAALAGTSTARTLDNDWKDVYGLSVDFACQLAPRALDELPRPQAKTLDPSGPSSMVGARAGALTAVSACASGAEAVSVGMSMIRDGRADVVVVGGTEACIHPMTLAAFANIRALSSRVDDPATASRPYDVERDGFVLGEGAAILVLESEAHAAARGARVYAYAGGRGMASDAHHISAPSAEGQASAVREAVADADVEPKDIVHLNAHGTSTPLGDIGELEAVRTALDHTTDQIVVTSTKSMTGHLMGGAGALESLFSALAVHHRVAPPTINIETLDPQTPMQIAQNSPVDLPAGDIAALNNAFGFGGHDVTVVFTSA